VSELAFAFRRGSNKKGPSFRKVLKRLSKYITGDWNSIDIINIVLLVVWVSYRIENWKLAIDAQHLIGSYNLEDVTTADGNGRYTYVNLAYLADRSTVENNWLAVVMVLYW
jgi:hypothetical protein